MRSTATGPPARKRRRLWCTGQLVLVCGICLWSGALLARAVPEAGAIDLFDGKTLSGWWSVGAADWHVTDGVIEARGEGAGFLVTEARYANFRLIVEFWVEAGVNSGVFVACPDLGEPDPEKCYEINIWDDHPTPPARTGSIVHQVMPPLVREDTIGKWNRYEISRVDSRLEVRLNGRVTAVLDGARTEAGHLAVQHAGNGTVRFRKVRLQLLDVDEAAAETAVKSGRGLKDALPLSARTGLPESEITTVVLLGTGTPIPDPHRSGPALAIVVNDSPYIVDFGPGLVRRAAALSQKYGGSIEGLELKRINRAFLTHLHSDHTAGFADLILTPWVMDRDEPLEVYGPEGITRWQYGKTQS